MISLSDTLKTSSIKFRSRKIRTFFSGCSISLGILTIMVFLLGTAGVNSVISSAYKDSLNGRYFASGTIRNSSIYSNLGPQDLPLNIATPTPTPTIKEFNKDEYLSKNSQYEIKNSYFINDYYSTPFEIEGLKVNSNIYSDPGLFGGGYYSEPASTESTWASKAATFLPAFFVQDYIYQNYSFNKSGDNQSIPALLSKSFVISTGEQLPSNYTEKQKYEKYQEIFQKNLGKTFKIKTRTGQNGQKLQPVEFEVKVVGYHAGGSGLGDNLGLSDNIIMPDWAESEIEGFESYKSARTQRLITEFNSKSDRDDFVNANSYQFGREIPVDTKSRLDGEAIIDSQSPIFGKFELFSTIIDTIRNVGVGIGLFFLAIAGLFILFTVAKIVSDSRKEIGVYRAVGGQKTDIIAIFYSYTWLLVSLGFVMGVIIAFIFNVIVSLIYGEDLFYSIILYGTSTDVSKPLFMFIGLPIVETLILYIFIIIVGFLAALFPVLSASNVDPIKALREE